MNITVIGVGYVGLSSGIAMAYIGHQVKFVDTDLVKIIMLNTGKAPFYEPGLDEMLTEVQSRIAFTTDYETALCDCELIFLAVGTPQKNDGAPDLRYLWEAIDEIIKHKHVLDSFVLLVNKSTAPVGTVERINKKLIEAGMNMETASNPEFLQQGKAIKDNLYPSRLIFGGSNRAHEILRNVYEAIILQDFNPPAFFNIPEKHSVSVYEMDSKTAELSKYAANAFLAMKISFINEIANIADLTGTDVTMVADAIGSDHRIGRMFLNAGIGYGGSCFPKDTRALKHIASTNGYDFKLLTAVIDVNNQQLFQFINKIKFALGDLEGKVITLLGLTFKPETDDIREAPSINIIHNLLEQGAIIRAHDPIGIDNAKGISTEVDFYTGLTNALSGADAAGILTEWDMYCSLTPEFFLQYMNGNIIVDGRNCLNPDLFKQKMQYIGIGRGSYKH